MTMNSLLEPPPAWWTDGYADDPVGLRIATRRWYEPKTTPAEREAVKNFRRNDDPTYPCASCGRFAFPSPRTCFWCVPRIAAAAPAPLGIILPETAPSPAKTSAAVGIVAPSRRRAPDSLTLDLL